MKVYDGDYEKKRKERKMIMIMIIIIIITIIIIIIINGIFSFSVSFSFTGLTNWYLWPMAIGWKFFSKLKFSKIKISGRNFLSKIDNQMTRFLLFGRFPRSNWRKRKKEKQQNKIKVCLKHNWIFLSSN